MYSFWDTATTFTRPVFGSAVVCEGDSTGISLVFGRSFQSFRRNRLTNMWQQRIDGRKTEQSNSTNRVALQKWLRRVIYVDGLYWIRYIPSSLMTYSPVFPQSAVQYGGFSVSSFTTKNTLTTFTKPLWKKDNLFWKCWNSKLSKNKQVNNSVDGVADSAVIVDHFVSQFF